MGFFEQHAGVVDQIAGGEVVGPVHHDVVVLQNVERILAGQRHLVPVDADVRIDVEHRLSRRIELLAAHVLGAVDDLPLQIGVIDDVEVHQSDAADARRRQVHAEGRAQTAGSDQQHLSRLELQLPLHAHFGHDQVAAVTLDLLVR